MEDEHHSVIRFTAALRSLIASGCYDDALIEISLHENLVSKNSELLIMKGRCIQLAEHYFRYSLDDARVAFENSIKLDPNNYESMLELGWLHLSVFDEADIALQYFDLVIKNGSADLAFSAIKGKAICIHEIHSYDAAIDFVNGCATLNGDERQVLIDAVS